MCTSDELREKWQFNALRKNRKLIAQTISFLEGRSDSLCGYRLLDERIRFKLGGPTVDTLLTGV